MKSRNNRTKHISLLITVIALLIILSVTLAACSLFVDMVKSAFGGDVTQQTTPSSASDTPSTSDNDDSENGSWSEGGSGGSGSDSGSSDDTDSDGDAGNESGSGNEGGGSGSGSGSTEPVTPTETDLVTITTSLVYDKASSDELTISAVHPGMYYSGLMGMGLTASTVRQLSGTRSGHGELQISGTYLCSLDAGKYDFIYILEDSDAVKHYEAFELTVQNSKAEPYDVKIDYDIDCPNVYVTFKCDCGSAHVVSLDGKEESLLEGADRARFSGVDKQKRHTAVVECQSGAKSSMTKASPDAAAYNGGYLTSKTYSFMGHTSDCYIEDDSEAEDAFNYLIYKGESGSLEVYISSALYSHFTSKDYLSGLNLSNPWSVKYGCTYTGNVATFSVTLDDVSVISSGYEDDRDCADLPFVSHCSAINSRVKGSKLPIDDKPGVTVRNVKELLAVVEAGYRPIAEGATLSLYNAARDLNYTYISNSMSDVEKLHVIYDYLAGEIDYDYSALNLFMIVQSIPSLSLEEAKTLLNDAVAEEGFGFSDSMKETIEAACVASDSTDALYKKLKEGYLSRLGAFSIEGVLSDGAAVCEGISYTFMLLARIEGIECVQISGDATDNGSKVAHAWNKVRLADGKWYCIDATWGNVFMGSKTKEITAASLRNIGITRVIVGGTKYVTHRYFMIEESVFSESHEEHIGSLPGVKNLALGDVEYYKSVETEEGHSLYISDYADLVAAVRYYAEKQSGVYYMEFMVDPAYDVMPRNDPPLMEAFKEEVASGFTISYVNERVFLAYFVVK